MPTQSQIEANRRNAQKSTGPRTAEGKAHVSLNALKHGIRARALVDQLHRTPLWDEDPQDFADLVESLVDQYQPEGPLEETCVEDIAINLWRLRRVARAETGHIARGQGFLLELPGLDNPASRARQALPDFDVLEKLIRYETAIRRQLDRALQTLTRLQATRASDLKREIARQREISSIRRDIIRHLLPKADSPAAPEKSPNKPNDSETADVAGDASTYLPPCRGAAVKRDANAVRQGPGGQMPVPRKDLSNRPDARASAQRLQDSKQTQSPARPGAATAATARTGGGPAGNSATRSGVHTANSATAASVLRLASSSEQTQNPFIRCQSVDAIPDQPASSPARGLTRRPENKNEARDPASLLPSPSHLLSVARVISLGYNTGQPQAGYRPGALLW